MTAITRHLLGAARGQQLWVSLTWRPAEPFAVAMDMHTHSSAVRWVFALDLLVDGLHAPAGLGDVQVRPAGQTTEVVLWPDYPDEAVIGLAAGDVAGFVADTWTADPPPLPDFLEGIDFGGVAS